MKSETKRIRMIAGAIALTGALAVSACGSNSDETTGSGASGQSEIETETVTPFAQVVGIHSETDLGSNLAVLEGGAFGPDGKLYFVDASAPAGKPKVLRLALATKETESVYTDDSSLLASVQFSPLDRKMYVTEFHTGAIFKMNPDGSEVTPVFDGVVDGRAMVADDIAFDPEGNMYITDYVGTPWEPTGRIVRLEANGSNPTVLQGGLAKPNGISFGPDYKTLWVSEYAANREARLELSSERKEVSSGGIGMYISDAKGHPDSNAIDSEGNIYQPMQNAGRVVVWNPSGEEVATILVDDSLPKPQMKTTSLVIEPGTTNGYLIAGGDNGGYVYEFTALAPGGEQSNGGGAVFP